MFSVYGNGQGKWPKLDWIVDLEVDDVTSFETCGRTFASLPWPLKTSTS